MMLTELLKSMQRNAILLAMEPSQNFFSAVLAKVRLLLSNFTKKESEIRSEAQHVLDSAVANANERRISQLKDKISKL